jgi:heat shock protein HslJ
VLAGLVVAACGGGAAPTSSPSPTPPPSPPSAAPPTAGPIAALPGSSWVVTGYAGRTGVATAVIPGTSITLGFGLDGTGGGTAGCNSYGGDYRLDAGGGTLAFGPLMQTEMACLPDATMAQESAYVAALARTARFRIVDGRLTLLDAAGAVLVEAVPGAPAS